MTHDLTFLVPSRGRPKQARQLQEVFNETCTADTKLIIVVDQDDPRLSQYYTVLNGIGQVCAVAPGRRGMVAALNSAFEVFKGDLGAAVGFMGDDHRPRTRGWDRNYLDCLRELRSGFVYGNDLYQFERIATQCAFTSDIAQSLGYMCPPEFDHLCVDVVWNDWGNAMGRIRYLPDTIVEHMHYLNGKSVMDTGYQVVNSGQMAAHDSQAYREYNESGRFAADVAKLRQLIV